MDFLFLQNSDLFHGMEHGELESLLECLCAGEKAFEKGEVIFHAGDIAVCMGFVLSGSVQIEKDDLWGNKSILDNVGPGAVFAETYACFPQEPLLVSVVAAEPSKILFLRGDRLLKDCSKGCGYHGRLIRNLLTISVQKNLTLSRRIFHTSSKSIRGRLLSYLSFQAARCRSYDFTIPFNRQQLADYLSVDRSALSNELSKMQREGLLKVNRNHFVLLKDAFAE